MASTLEQLPAKVGTNWLWRHRTLKGAVHLAPGWTHMAAPPELPLPPLDHMHGGQIPAPGLPPLLVIGTACR